MSSLEDLKSYVRETLWPQFVAERPELTNPVFKENWTRISEEDAFWFLQAMKRDLIKHKRRALFYMPRSKTSEQFFWTGTKKQIPRPVFLWSEPIITVAALAKLHVKFAWPVEYLATQPKGGQFDLAVFRSVSGDAMLIACEAKKTEQEALFLVSELTRLSHENVQIGVGLKNEQRNAFRKLAAIRDRKPDLLWIIGPGEHKRVFQITYEPHVALHYASEELLHFERRGSLTFEERPFEIITLEQAKALNGKITLPIADALKQAAYKISNPQIREAALDAIRRNDEVTAWKIISGPDGPSEYLAEQS